MPDETPDANPEGAASTAPEKQPKVFGEDYVRQLREESKARRLEIERLESQLNELKATAQGGPDDDVKKTLNELKAQGLIDIGRKRITILDPARLQALADE